MGQSHGIILKIIAVFKIVNTVVIILRQLPLLLGVKKSITKCLIIIYQRQ